MTIERNALYMQLYRQERIDKSEPDKSALFRFYSISFF